MKSEVVETETDRQWLGKDGILYVETFPNAEVTLTNARQITAAHGQLTGGKKRPLLVDMSKIKLMTREARVHLSGESVGNHATAVALVVRSPISRVIGNFFLGLNKTSFPTRLFISKTDAVQWLKGFLKEA